MCFNLHLSYAEATSISCQNLISIQPDSAAIGSDTWHVTWSDKKISTYGTIERVGRENIIFSVDKNNEVKKIEVLLPNGDIHKIKVTKFGLAVVSEKLTEDFVLASGIEFLPIKLVTGLKTLRFHYISGLGELSALTPWMVTLDPRELNRKTLTHELGHVTHYRTKLFYFRWRRAMKKDGNNIVSQYGSTATVEDFAETFVAYLETNDRIRDKYRQLYPNRFDLMDRVFKGELSTSFEPIQRILIGPNPYVGSVIFAGGITLALMLSMIGL